MTIERPEDIEPMTVVHRVGGGEVANLRLSPLDQKQEPPGISTLLGGTPQGAADQMRCTRLGLRSCRTLQAVFRTTLG
jgi:hypothetical protein